MMNSWSWSYLALFDIQTRRKKNKIAMGRRWPNRNTSLPFMCYPAKFGGSRSNDTNVIKENGKNWPLASRLSRSIKVARTDTDRSAIYDLITFHSNHKPISYRFRDKWRFQSKIANFPTPVYLTPPLKGFFLKLGIGAGVRKMNGATRWSKKF